MGRKRRIFGQLGCIVLCVVLLFSTFSAAAHSFPDVDPGDDYSEAIEQLSEMGILTGDERGYFNPHNAITRAEAATIICRLMGVEDEAKMMRKVVFNDVPVSHWAVGYVAMAADMGIINGNGDGSFAPEDPVTQQQMVKMLVCAMDYGEEAQELGGWFSGYWQLAQDFGIIGLDEEVLPEPASRAEVAIYVFNYTNIE